MRDQTLAAAEPVHAEQCLLPEIDTATADILPILNRQNRCGSLRYPGADNQPWHRFAVGEGHTSGTVMNMLGVTPPKFRPTWKSD